MQKKRPVSRLSLLRPDFMVTQNPLLGSARIDMPVDPLYPVPARLLAQLFQIMDEVRRLEGKESLSDAEISALTGRDNLTRTFIREQMDEDRSVRIPADYVYELGNHISNTGKTLNDIGIPSIERDEAIRKLKLQFMNLFFDGIKQGGPAPKL